MAKFSGAKVTELLGKDFDSSFKLKKKPAKPGMLVFYMSWCHFCQLLVPEFKKLSKQSGVKIYAVNCEGAGNDVVYQNFGVSGFPNIRYVSKSGVIDGETYYGERDVKSMMKYIKEKSTKGGAKKAAKKEKKKPAKKCSGKGCKGKCSGGKCKKAQKGGCSGGKCSGACKGGACKKAHKGGAKKRGRGRPKDGTLKKMKKAVKKSLKKVKKMLGGKKKAAKKPAKKAIKKRGKK